MSRPISHVVFNGCRTVGVAVSRRTGFRLLMFDRLMRVPITASTCGNSLSSLTLNMGNGFIRLTRSLGIDVIRLNGFVGIISLIGLCWSSDTAAAWHPTDRFAGVRASHSPPSESRALAFGARASRVQTAGSHAFSAQSNTNERRLTAWAEALPRPSTVSAPEDWAMFDGRISRISIDVPASVSAVAKALTRARPWVSHLNVVAGEVLLSGQQEGVNWLASLVSGDPHADGVTSTRGYLSVWVPRGLAQSHRIAPLFDALPMPPAARLIFDIDDADAAFAAALQVWRAPAAWRDPCADLATSLRQTGWHGEAAPATAMMSWRRDRDVATVYCRRDGRDTLIFMHRGKERT